MGTLSELEAIDEEQDTFVCPVCQGPTDRVTSFGFALPCVKCPRPPTPPSRRLRELDPDTGMPKMSKPTSISTAKTVTSPAPIIVEPRAAKTAASTSVLASAAKAVVPDVAPMEIPDKTLVIVPKGFNVEYGTSRISQEKGHIVDDDRYAPFYSHYFAKGKRKHAIWVGTMPETGDPVMLALEQLASEQDDDMPAPESIRGLLFTCKPLSKNTDDRWVFLDPHASMPKELAAKQPALAGVKWKEVIDDGFSDQLLGYEQKVLSNTDRFKFGVLYCHENQTGDENAMFSNKEGSAELFKFLSGLGDRIALKGWDKYSGGLNTKDDTTGTEAYYTSIRGLQIMFHVSVFLPHRDGDEQRLDKKRHLGNDVVLIVFCDSDNVKFDPLEIHSQFNHVFVVVVPMGISPENGRQLYKVSIVRKPGVPIIEPKLKFPAIYEEGDIFREMFLTKLINAERLSMYAPDFVRKMYRTRKELMLILLKDVKTKKSSRLTEVLGSTRERIAQISSDGNKRGSVISSARTSDLNSNNVDTSSASRRGGHQRTKSLGRLVSTTIGKKDSSRSSTIGKKDGSSRSSKNS